MHESSALGSEQAHFMKCLGDLGSDDMGVKRESNSTFRHLETKYLPA